VIRTERGKSKEGMRKGKERKGKEGRMAGRQ
jgi:hypothetical protein